MNEIAVLPADDTEAPLLALLAELAENDPDRPALRVVGDDA